MNYNTDCTFVNNECDSGRLAPNLILKIIANPETIALATKDTSNGDENVYKGVQVLPFLYDSYNRKTGTFGALGDFYTDFCKIYNQYHFPLVIYSSYDDCYIDYNLALGSFPGQQFLFN